MKKTLYKSITYDSITNTVTGTTTDYKELNRENPGDTLKINGSCEAIKQYLYGTSNPKYMRWGYTRLLHLFKEVYHITNPTFECTDKPVIPAPTFKPAPLIRKIK